MQEDIDTKWIAPKASDLPDFIIGGAMKSGTSTLHAILDKHPDVFIPKEELGFFDADNIVEHFDFNFYDAKRRRWVFQDMANHSEQMWQWYRDHFKKAGERMKGEDSTSYLASPIAASRIAKQPKPIKVIFLLRQPTKRAYSNYFHLLRAGIVGHTFERALEYYPRMFLHRSLYKQQLESYFNVLPKEQIKVIVFEDFIKNTAATMQDVCDFLGLDFSKFQQEDFSIHANRAKLPRSLRLLRWKNRMSRGYGNSFYLENLPLEAPFWVKRRMFRSKFFNKAISIINPLKEKPTPDMRPETQQFLDDYFKTELHGMNELLGKDVLSKWF